MVRKPEPVCNDFEVPQDRVAQRWQAVVLPSTVNLRQAATDSTEFRLYRSIAKKYAAQESPVTAAWLMSACMPAGFRRSIIIYIPVMQMASRLLARRK